MNKKGFVLKLSPLIFLILFVIVSIIFLFSFNKGALICHDGTAYDTCSKIKPYFCSGGILIENASFCNCFNISEINGDRCVSEYQTSPKNITLYYTLKGKKQEINFAVYDGLYIYLSKLPRYILADKEPTLLDFKLRTLNDISQRGFLLPLIIEIQNLAKNKEDQARIAISLVQNIPFGGSNKTFQFGSSKMDYQRYPYEVLYDFQGICSEKSELLVFLLRELGYGTSFLYYHSENHEAVGIKCPKEKSLNNTDYCFVETTGPSIITDDRTEYLGINQLNSTPIVINVSDGISLGDNLYEYGDAKDLMKIRESIKKDGTINPLQYIRFKQIKKKYGLVNVEDSYKFN